MSLVCGDRLQILAGVVEKKTRLLFERFFEEAKGLKRPNHGGLIKS